MGIPSPVSQTPNTVTDGDIERYKPMVTKMAKRLSGLRGAEYDDLVQEGYISVWLAYRDGHTPSQIVCRNRMRNWVRLCARRGFSGHDALDYVESVVYEDTEIDENAGV